MATKVVKNGKRKAENGKLFSFFGFRLEWENGKLFVWGEAFSHWLLAISFFYYLCNHKDSQRVKAKRRNDSSKGKIGGDETISPGVETATKKFPGVEIGGD